MTKAKSKGQQRRIDIQRGYGEMSAKAAQRIKDKCNWTLINYDRVADVPEIAKIIQEVADESFLLITGKAP